MLSSQSPVAFEFAGIPSAMDDLADIWTIYTHAKCYLEADASIALFGVTWNLEGVRHLHRKTGLLYTVTVPNSLLSVL